MKKRVICFAVRICMYVSVLFLWDCYQGNLQEQLKEKELKKAATHLESDRKQDERTDAVRIDFDALKTLNPDIVGWLVIPGTKIDTPVLQNDNNETYCHRDFYGNENRKGSIFLDCDSPENMMGFHNIFYGHHMKNGDRFAQIRLFRQEEFFKNHRVILIYTPQGTLKLKTIAAVTANDSCEHRKTTFVSLRELECYIKKETKNCTFREISDLATDRLYSFVTCSYEFPGARTILYAVPQI